MLQRRPRRVLAGMLLYLMVTFVAPVSMVVAPLVALLLMHRPGRREAFIALMLGGLAFWARVGLTEAFAAFESAWVLLLTGSLFLVLGTRAGAAQRPVASSLLAVGIAGTAGTLLIGITSLSFAELSWLAERHFSGIFRMAIALVGAAQDGGTGEPNALAGALETSSMAFVRFVSVLLPGLLLLQSFGALALAWTLYRAIAREPEGAPLPALKEFRFNDHLIWGVVTALVLLVLPWLAPLQSVGTNLAAFFGGLYLLRGLGVLAALLATAGLSGIPAALLGLFVGLFLLPIFAIVALMIGVTDTWIDWRRRLADPRR